MTSAPVYEVVLVTGSRGLSGWGYRWALRQLETGAGYFIADNHGNPLTWATLQDVDEWLAANYVVQDGGMVIWPSQLLAGKS